MDSRVKAKVDRLSTAVSNIRSALTDKGVDAAGHGAEDFATDITNMPPAFDPDDYVFKITLENGEYGRSYDYVGKTTTTLPSNKYENNTSIIEVNLPFTITTIGSSAFSGATSLKYINLEHITHVGEHAFGWCTKMRRFNFENVVSLAPNFLVGNNSRTGLIYDVEEILLPKLETVPQLIAGEYKITSTRYPNLRLIDLSGAKTLGSGTSRVVESISNDSKINVTIKFGKDVKIIKDNAFADTLSINLGILDFPKLTNLNGSAFCRSGVQKVINLGSITTIYTNTFLRCNNLTFVRIPSTVTTIGVNAFLENHSGMIMVIEAVTPPSTSSAPTADAIYVPDESVDSYKAATGWSAIASKIHPLSEYTGSD